MLNGKHILFDPFITQNPLAKNIDIDSIEADYIFVSHGHSDHIADCVSIAKRTGAQVVAAYEVATWLGQQGVENVFGMNTGGSWKFDFGTVKCVVAHHSSCLPDGSYGGNPIGFVVMSTDRNFYYAGDTALTLDMQLIPHWTNLNFSVLPIGNVYTMDVADAIHASEFVKSPVVVGVHYDTFDYIKIDKEKAVADFKAAEKILLLPGVGETITL